MMQALRQWVGWGSSAAASPPPESSRASAKKKSRVQHPDRAAVAPAQQGLGSRVYSCGEKVYSCGKKVYSCGEKCGEILTKAGKFFPTTACYYAGYAALWPIQKTYTVLDAFIPSHTPFLVRAGSQLMSSAFVGYQVYRLLTQVPIVGSFTEAVFSTVTEKVTDVAKEAIYTLVTSAFTRTLDCVVNGSISVVKGISDTALNMTSSPLETIQAVASTSLSATIAVSSAAKEVAIPLGLGALIHYAKTRKPPLKWLPYFTSTCDVKQEPSRYAVWNRFSPWGKKAPPQPVKLCLNQEVLLQAEKLIEHLQKDQKGRHIQIIEPRGNETTQLIRAIRQSTKCSYMRLTPHDISLLVFAATSPASSQFYKCHLELFKELAQWVRSSPYPTILHLEEADRILTPSLKGNQEQEQKVYQEINNALRELAKTEQKLILIGETKTLDSLDIGVRVHSLYIDLPDEQTRVAFLKRALDTYAPDPSTRSPLLTEEVMYSIARRTPGLQGEDLNQLMCDLISEHRWRPLTLEHIEESIDYLIEDYYRRLERNKPRLADKFHPFNAPHRKKRDGLDNKETPTAQPVFNKELTKELQEVIQWNRNILHNSGDMQHLLLHGEPGTGKTLIAEKIARESGFNYISMNGSDLARFIRDGSHLEAFEELMRFIRQSPEPTIWFIDEIEVFAEERGNLDQPRREILNEFLAFTGTPSKRLMVIGTTNRVQDIDEAVLSRMTNKIHIGLPNYASRVRILTNLIDDKMGDIPEKQSCLDSRAIEVLAKRTAGLSGRTMVHLVSRLQSKRDSSQDGRLTEDRVEDVTYQVVKEARTGSSHLGSLVSLAFDLWHFHLPRLRRLFLNHYWYRMFRRSHPA